MKLIPVTSSVAAMFLLGAMAGCASPDTAADAADDTAAETTSDAPTDSSGEAAGRAGGAAAPRPGTAGEIAAMDGLTLQVQNPQSGQVAVTYDDATTFTEQVEASLAEVTVGSCVLIGLDGEPGASSATAASVRLSEPVDGECALGDRGDGGDGESGRTRPSGAPTDRPTDRPDGRQGRAGGGSGAIGEVTAVTGDGFTVQPSAPATDASVEAIEVAVGDDTTYTTSTAADADSLKVGRCVNASGTADDTGAVAATEISVSDPVDGTCAAGVRGRERGDIS